MSVIELTQKLVQIPSYVDNKNNEANLANFIEEYIKTHLNSFQVCKQQVEGSRYNLIASDGFPPKIIFFCHMDTVPLSPGWKFDPFAGAIENNRLYGLGAVDMKGGLACALHAAKQVKNTKGLTLVFDVDEEYYFKGISKYLQKYSPRSQLAVFPEPGMKIRNGHRGVIEIYFRLYGKTGHASRPKEGINAIVGVANAVSFLEKELQKYGHPKLGESTCNLSFLQGGVYGGEQEGTLILEKCANKIPDVAAAIIDVRPARSEVNATSVVQILQEFATKNNYRLEAEIRLDYGAFHIEKAKLTRFANIVSENILDKDPYADARNFGYGEGEIVYKKLGIPCAYFGPGPTKKAHEVDEYVYVDELEKTERIFIQTIQNYCCGA